ncbi:MAG: aspartyl protease family protein [Nitrospirota bacterium]
MGETFVRLRIYGPKGVRELDTLVDTGATYTKIPKEVAEDIGLQLEYETEVELADKRLVRRRLGLAQLEIEGVRRPVLVSVSEDDKQPLIGYTTLELLEFAVNPLTRRLERARPIEYRYIYLSGKVAKSY